MAMTSVPQRICLVVVVVAFVLATSCAGDDAELVALREQVQALQSEVSQVDEVGTLPPPTTAPDRWEVLREVDPMTDQVTVSAYLTADTAEEFSLFGDPRLVVICAQLPPPGVRFATLLLVSLGSSFFPEYDSGSHTKYSARILLRFDKEGVHELVAPVSEPEGLTSWFYITDRLSDPTLTRRWLKMMLRADRLLVSRDGGNDEVHEFDLRGMEVGAARALRQCGHASLS